MKILMGSSYFASHSGGLDLVAGVLFKELAALGQEIVWMAGDITPPPDPTGQGRTVSLPIWNFVEDKTGTPFPIPSPASLRTIVREVRNADVLLLHDCLYLSNIIAFIAARWRGIPILIIQHTRYFPNEAALVNNVIKFSTVIVTRPMLARASQVVFIGEITRRFFEQVRFQRPPQLIFNGVDTELFRPLRDSETVEDLRRKYDLPLGRTTILFVGRFVQKKGIRAMRRMAALRPDWTWVFAGWGPIDPKEWNLPNVRVLNSLRGEMLAPLYRCCDLLVLPSIGEGGFPLVPKEALSSNLAVVCGEETIQNDPAMRPFVSTAPVNPRDDEQTACNFLAAIDESLKSDIRTLHRNSRAVIEKGYSWPNAARRYLEVLSALVPKNETSPSHVKQTGEGLPG